MGIYDNCMFFDTNTLVETSGIKSRATIEYLQKEFNNVFPTADLKVLSVKYFGNGKYRNALNVIKGLPQFFEIKISHCTGKHYEKITVWCPVKWNDRFLGAPGGGTATGGDNYITKPNNFERGMTLPKGIINGFTVAMTDASNTKAQWAIDKKTGEIDKEKIENWRATSTHFMTLCGKVVAEILHRRPVKYSYLSGGSGGGRQALVEAQEYPEDYNGIWASSPAINWNRLLPSGLWMTAIRNSTDHLLTRKKAEFLLKEARNSVGGEEAYLKYNGKVSFDPYLSVGKKVGNSTITEKDAQVMKMMWDGPQKENGDFLWYSCRPGVRCWFLGLPVGMFYYTLSGDIKPFFLVTFYMRWVTGNIKHSFNDVTLKDFEELFLKSVEKFPNIGADNEDLTAFYENGGKLIIDHGIDDPIIPVDGTIDYCKRVKALMGDKTDSFLRLYTAPGDGHANCTHYSPGISQSEGMKALIDWVENGIAPEEIKTVQVTRQSKKIIKNGIQAPYKFREE